MSSLFYPYSEPNREKCVSRLADLAQCFPDWQFLGGTEKRTDNDSLGEGWNFLQKGDMVLYVRPVQEISSVYYPSYIFKLFGSNPATENFSYRWGSKPSKPSRSGFNIGRDAEAVAKELTRRYIDPYVAWYETHQTLLVEEQKKYDEEQAYLQSVRDRFVALGLRPEGVTNMTHGFEYEDPDDEIKQASLYVFPDRGNVSISLQKVPIDLALDAFKRWLAVE